MIWIDVATPKYAHFFLSICDGLRSIDPDIWITTRKSEGYTEATSVLDMHQTPYDIVGNYGGQTLEGKYRARMQRGLEFADLITKRGMPKALLCGSVVDSIHAAYGLGVPVFNFCDTPLRSYCYSANDITKVTRLTAMLSHRLLYPFVIPGDIFQFMGLGSSQLVEYDFIDVCLWVDKILSAPGRDFRLALGVRVDVPTILFREEEYMAHYVESRLPIVYDLANSLAARGDCNVIMLARYDADELRSRLGRDSHVHVLSTKFPPECIYPYIDLLVGGGGTMNLEAAACGIPVISARSFWLYHDKYLVDNGLMRWIDNVDAGLCLVDALVGTRTSGREYLGPRNLQPSLDRLLDIISSDLR